MSWLTSIFASTFHSSFRSSCLYLYSFLGLRACRSDLLSTACSLLDQLLILLWNFSLYKCLFLLVLWMVLLLVYSDYGLNDLILQTFFLVLILYKLRGLSCFRPLSSFLYVVRHLGHGQLWTVPSETVFSARRYENCITCTSKARDVDWSPVFLCLPRNFQDIEKNLLNKSCTNETMPPKLRKS